MFDQTGLSLGLRRASFAGALVALQVAEGRCGGEVAGAAPRLHQQRRAKLTWG